MLRRVVAVVQGVALVATVAFVVLLFANEPGDDGATTAEEEPSAVADGATIYADRCAGCHGADGAGGVGPPLGGGVVAEVYPDPADQVEVVAGGLGGMPAFGSRLSQTEIEAVVAYTREDLG